MNEEKDAAVNRAHRWKLLAESLQKRYSSQGILPRGGEKGSLIGLDLS
ncbi:MAG: hypothetical protein RQ885_10500 [Desulfurococcales archaeon]|jgi:hypothetical protein|nr:hypothetical protein [Desulfurococcales archaeon]